jgi:uncharacterized membrane protein HdeD (DUF308 family)
MFPVNKKMEVETLKLPNWARTFAVIGGIASIMAGILVLAFPGLGVLFVVYLLGFALTLLGLERLTVGITGQAYKFSEKRQPMNQPQAQS